MGRNETNRSEVSEGTGLGAKLLRYVELRLELLGLEAADQLRRTVARMLYILVILFVAGMGLVFFSVALAGLINRLTQTHAGDWAVAVLYTLLLLGLLASQKPLLSGLNHFLAKQAKPLPLPQPGEITPTANGKDENASAATG